MNATQHTETGQATAIRVKNTPGLARYFNRPSTIFRTSRASKGALVVCRAKPGY